MLYRKGSEILSSLHYLMCQSRLKSKNETEGLHNLSMSFTEEALIFEAAMTLNNILIDQADRSEKPHLGNVDISKISLSNLISDTDSRLWNFIYLLTMNKSLREKVEKSCGVDWSCHLCTSNESETLGERTSKILMVISLCLFTCNDKASLMQLLLSDVVASFSGSSELNRIFNQLGITVSYETIHCYITNVVDALIENHMKSSFVTDAFLVTSVDNVDKGTPYASLSFGNTNYGLHGTSVQAVQPKPYSIKNDPTDYVMFQRKPDKKLSVESDNDLYEVPVYPDGRCLFL